MRKLAIYFLAAFIVTSCDNLKTKSETKTDDEKEETVKKKKKALDDDETTDEEVIPKKKKKVVDENDDATSDDNANDEKNVEYGDEWTDVDRNKFLKQCVKDAAVTVGEEVAQERCSCFLKKVENKYSSYSEADAKMTKTELNKWASECKE